MRQGHRNLLPVIAALVLSLLLGLSPARAATDQQELVIRAQLTVESMLSNPREFPNLPSLVHRAKAVLVVPSLVKAGFIFGAEGGSGVLLAREASGGWSYPAFYFIGTGSIGLQIGVQDAEVLFVVMTDKGLNALMNQEMKLGVDASIAVGPVGGGVGAATTTALGADIVAFFQTRGLFGGGALEGSVIAPRNEWNAAYYSPGADPRGIVLEGRFANHAADALRDDLARY